MNFKLKTPNTRTNSLILFYVTLSGGKRFVYSTGQKIPVRLWDKHSQFPKRTKSQNDQVITNSVNIRLESLKTAYLNLNFQYKSSGRILTKEILKQEFDILFKGVSKKTAPNDFDSCFEDFFKFKLKEGGWSNSTAKRYRMLYKLVKEFEKTYYKIEIELIDVSWIADFKSYCQEIKSHQVNTLGRNLGLLKTFLNYCLKNDFITNSSFKEVAVSRDYKSACSIQGRDTTNSGFRSVK